MFREHQPIIARYARAGPEAFGRVVTFAMVSAHVPLYRLPEQMRAIDQDGLNAGSDILFAWKYEGLRRLRLELTELFEDCETLAARPDRLLARLVGVFGLGYAKAGFTAQLVYGVSGCLDSHNLARFNIPESRFHKRIGQTDKTVLRRARAYNRTIARWGGTEALWDDWCDHVARSDYEVYTSARQVSRLHLEALGLH